MGWFKTEPSFESVAKTANGFMAGRLQAAGRKCQEDLNHVSLYSSGNTGQYAEAFADYIDSISRIFISSYRQSLTQLGVDKPSKKLSVQIRAEVSASIDKFIEGHRAQVTEFASRVGGAWPWNNTEYAIHVARTYVDGQLELIQHEAPSRAISQAGSQSNDRSGVSLKVKILGALGAAVLTAGGVAIDKLYIEPKAEAQHRKLESRHDLQKLVFPMLDSIMIFGDSVQFAARKRPDKFDHVEAAFRRGGESLLTSGPAVTTAIEALFGHKLSEAYLALTDSALSGLERVVDSLSLNMSPAQHKSQAVIDSAAYNVLTAVNGWSHRAQLFKRDLARAVIEAD